MVKLLLIYVNQKWGLKNYGLVLLIHILKLMKELRSESDVFNSGKTETRSSSSVP